VLEYEKYSLNTQKFLTGYFMYVGHFKELFCYKEKKTLFIQIILMPLLDNSMFIFQAIVQTLPKYPLIIEEGSQSV
jgi:hydrogenase-4 membrane subunit HyfE